MASENPTLQHLRKHNCGCGCCLTRNSLIEKLERVKELQGKDAKKSK